VRALVGCADGLYTVEVGDEAEGDELVSYEEGEALGRERRLDLVPPWAASQSLDVDALGATIVLLLDRRPPLMISTDRGATWTERGAGLPAGRAVALGETPDDILFAGRNRVFVSRNGGVFWRALAVELPEIHEIAWA
jgi:hypothetical protein